MPETYQECQNCRFFKRKWKKVQKRRNIQQYRNWDGEFLTQPFQTEVKWDEYEPEDYGTCRRYPPQLVTSNHSPVDLFPTIDADDYCGEWRETRACLDGKSRKISAYPSEA